VKEKEEEGDVIFFSRTARKIKRRFVGLIGQKRSKPRCRRGKGKKRRDLNTQTKKDISFPEGGKSARVPVKKGGKKKKGEESGFSSLCGGSGYSSTGGGERKKKKVEKGDRKRKRGTTPEKNAILFSPLHILSKKKP